MRRKNHTAYNIAGTVRLRILIAVLRCFLCYALSDTVLPIRMVGARCFTFTTKKRSMLLSLISSFITERESPVWIWMICKDGQYLKY
jgi:hypothetical protein